MTPEQRAALVLAAGTIDAGRMRPPGPWVDDVITAVNIIEAAGYSIVPTAEHIEATRLRSRVEAQRHEIARLHARVIEARKQAEDAGAEGMRAAAVAAIEALGNHERIRNKVAALPLPGDPT